MPRAGCPRGKYQGKSCSMKKLLWMASVVFMALSGCQNTNNTTPKLGSNTQPSSGLVRTPTPTNTSNGTLSANTFPPPGNTIPTAGNFPAAGSFGNTPSNSTNNGLGGSPSGTGRFTSTAVPPLGATDLKTSPIDKAAPAISSAGLSSNLVKTPPLSPAPPMNNLPASNPPTLPASPTFGSTPNLPASPTFGSTSNSAPGLPNNSTPFGRDFPPMGDPANNLR